MITSMVSAMGGPISLIVSGCLGGSRVWREWLWKWFPLSVDMLGKDALRHCRTIER